MTSPGGRISRVGRNSVARFTAQVWAKVLNLAMTAVMLQSVGATSLGRYLMVLTVGGIVLSVADMGLGVYLTRETARLDCVDQQRRLAGDVLAVKVVLAGSGYALILLASIVLPLQAQTSALLRVAGLTLVPDAAIAAVQSYLTGQRRLDLASGLIAGVRSLAALGGGALLLAGRGVMGVLWAGAAASCLGLLLGIRSLRRSGRAPVVDAGTLPSAARWRALLAESYPFAATGIIAMLYTRLDLLLLGFLHGEEVAGWYGAAYRLWEAVHLMPSSLLDALFPEMAQVAQRADGWRWLRRLVTYGAGAFAATGLLLALGGNLLGGSLLTLLYGAEAARGPTVQTWRVLSWAIPAVFVYLLGGQVLYAIGAQRKVTARMMVVALANTAANLLLIPRWRHIGAAVSMVATEWLLSGLLWGGALQELARQRRPKAEAY